MEKKTAVLPVVNPYAAGIDIGSRTHWVAVDQQKENVRSFGVYTQDHQQLIDHLRQHQITSVAMVLNTNKSDTVGEFSLWVPF